MAAGDLPDPVRGRDRVPADREPEAAEVAPGQAAGTELPDRRDHPGPARGRAGAGGWLGAAGGPAEPQPGCPAAHRRQLRDPDRGLWGVAARDGGGDRHRHGVRPVRVLHPRGGPDHDPVLRRAGPGRAAWREGVRPVRPHRVEGRPPLPPHHGAPGPDRRGVAADAAGDAAEGQVPASGPAQPPQAAGGRRPGGLHRLAEPDRPLLQQAREPEARPAVAGADDPGGGSGRAGAECGVHHRLVQRDRRVARRSGAGAGRPDPGAGDGGAGLPDRAEWTGFR